MKSESDVIADFNSTSVLSLSPPIAVTSCSSSPLSLVYSVNMSPKSLRAWLETEDSQTTGWHNPKSDGQEHGEAVGHQSGSKIVEILEKNPERKEDGYDEEDLEHMRKVVAYKYVLESRRFRVCSILLDDEALLTRERVFSFFRNWV
jgi:hypothetical protein